MYEELVAEAKASTYLPASTARRRAIREEAGASQARCARELGVDRATFSRWEAGHRRPRGEYLVRYVELLRSLQEAVR